MIVLGLSIPRLWTEQLFAPATPTRETPPNLVCLVAVASGVGVGGFELVQLVVMD